MGILFLKINNTFSIFIMHARVCVGGIYLSYPSTQTLGIMK